MAYIRSKAQEVRETNELQQDDFPLVLKKIRLHLLVKILALALPHTKKPFVSRAICFPFSNNVLWAQEKFQASRECSVRYCSFVSIGNARVVADTEPSFLSSSIPI